MINSASWRCLDLALDQWQPVLAPIADLGVRLGDGTQVSEPNPDEDIAFAIAAGSDLKVAGHGLGVVGIRHSSQLLGDRVHLLCSRSARRRRRSAGR